MGNWSFQRRIDRNSDPVTKPSKAYQMMLFFLAVRHIRNASWRWKYIIADMSYTRTNSVSYYIKHQSIIKLYSV